jgi:hypothetical protein
MVKNTVIPATLCVAFSVACTFPINSQAAEQNELTQIRTEMQQMKEAYEARLKALEVRLQQVSEQTAEIKNVSAPQPAATSSTTFNPAVSLILGGTYANLSQDPKQYRLQGFVPGGDVGPGARSFDLGESELTLSANVDTNFAGKLTFALTPDNSISVEEAFAETTNLSNGLNVKAGRFLSSVGYLNSQHAHAWDFVDAPLAYQAFLGSQYKTDGLQTRWLAPTDQFFELGAELGNGGAFPGQDRNKNGFGSAAVFAHLGDDIGESGSWRAGVSFLQTGAADRSYDDIDQFGHSFPVAFNGKSSIWIFDAIYKWAPFGNGTRTNFKLQGEVIQRKENGDLTADSNSSAYISKQSGGYVQGVYQFMPAWRVGLRYDWLISGTPEIGLSGNGSTAKDFSSLTPYNGHRSSVMFDFNPSEFSRIRLQFARDQSRPDAVDNQIFLQYIMSLGAHGAHSF